MHTLFQCRLKASDVHNLTRSGAGADPGRDRPQSEMSDSTVRPSQPISQILLPMPSWKVSTWSIELYFCSFG